MNVDIRSLVDSSLLAFTFAGTVFGGVRWLNRRLSPIQRMSEDWNGTPERPGVPARPGVMTRLWNIEQSNAAAVLERQLFAAQLQALSSQMERVEGQLKPNGGHTMRDAVNRIENQVSGGSNG